jgi:signal peptidase II
MRRVLVVGVASLVFVLDRFSKSVLPDLLSEGSPREIIGSTVQLIRSENRGGLFGLFQGSAPILALLSLGVVAALLVVHEREGERRPSALTLAIGLLIGGALGNLFDRIMMGYVLDFIDLGIGTLRFWTFNVADMGISFGILIMLLAALRLPRARDRTSQ